MSRIRTVKPELFRHEGLFEAEHSQQLPLRLAFIGLFTCCDREGRFRWRPRQLKLDIFPYDNVDMERVLDALTTRGFIVQYRIGDEIYGCIPSWHKHQYVNHRESASVLPGPDQANTSPCSPENDASATRDAPVNHSSRASTGIHGGKGKGKGKGRGNGIGREKEHGTEQEREHDASLSRASREQHDIVTVFDHWKTVMQHPDAQLDEKRQKTIGGALHAGYSIEQLCQAISGCRNTPHNMGSNSQGQRFDGLHIIFRDADQIDRFIHNFHQPPQLHTETDQRMQSSVNNLQHWLQKKLKPENTNEPT